MKRICKGKYVNVDSRNTECLKLIENYEKVHTLGCRDVDYSILELIIITNSYFFGFKYSVLTNYLSMTYYYQIAMRHLLVAL